MHVALHMKIIAAVLLLATAITPLILKHRQNELYENQQSAHYITVTTKSSYTCSQLIRMQSF